jgi:hypothetical protein
MLTLLLQVPQLLLVLHQPPLPLQPMLRLQKPMQRLPRLMPRLLKPMQRQRKLLLRLQRLLQRQLKLLLN